MTDPYADLCALYPWLPRPACGPGWHALVEAFCERVAGTLSRPELRALILVEVSEHRGRLRLRVQAPDQCAGRVQALVREAEDASAVACCQCGRPGHWAARGGWAATLCEEHQAQGMWLSP